MIPQMQLVKVVDRIVQGVESKNIDEAQLQCELAEFTKSIATLPKAVAQHTLPILVTPFLALHARREVHRKFSEEMKISLLNTLKSILAKAKIDNETGFNLLFDFLLLQIVDPRPTVTSVVTSEEHKLSVFSCFEALFDSMSWDLFPIIYTNKHCPKLDIFLHQCLEVLKNETNKQLRFSAVECVMKTAKVDDCSDPDDVVILSTIAEIFIKYLPGIAARLIVIAVDDTKCGQRLVVQCVKAWARLVSMLMREYNPLQEQRHLEDFISDEQQVINTQNALHNDKLALCAQLLMKLTAYDHPAVKKQLAESSGLLINTCFETLPSMMPKLVEILIVLAEDTCVEVCDIATKALGVVTLNLSEERGKAVNDCLHYCFHQRITQIPRIFNSVDSNEQLTAINLLAGYLKLFAQSSKLRSVLYDPTSLSRLIGSLLYVAQVEKSNISILEEYTLHDWNQTPDSRTPWKNFKFHDERIASQLECACHLLAQPVIIDIVLDCLLEVFHNDPDQRSEATLLINEILSVADSAHAHAQEVIHLYFTDDFWRLNLTVEANNSLKQVQGNIIQLCLQLEGVGKMALALGERFQRFLLKVLYDILENAGSGHPLLQAAGLTCTANISKACGYETVTELTNKNADYFAYHITNKLRRREENASVLRVLGVVLKYGEMAVLPSLADIIEGVLLQSCDRFQQHNAAVYLQVFSVIVKAMQRWFKEDVDIIPSPVITKREKKQKFEVMRQAHLEELRKPVDLSDDIMGKSAEELYREDLMNSEEEQEQEAPGYSNTTPTPPKHITLVVKILQRSLNHLPSKNNDCKIFVLEILNSGVEILRDYEDDLLPIVHQIWSPLVNRFKEQTPLIVNLSFTLLSTLGRLAKDFIRMRTIKEVLPEITKVLIAQSKDSYLKDRGSAYRYTQGYKMQVVILAGLARLAYDLDLDDKVTLVLPAVELYLCAKQPAPLQEAAVALYKSIGYVDPALGASVVRQLNEKYAQDVDWQRNLRLLHTGLEPDPQPETSITN